MSARIPNSWTAALAESSLRRAATATWNAIRRMLADPASARRFGEAAQEKVERDYSRDAMRLRFEEFYRELAGLPVG